MRATRPTQLFQMPVDERRLGDAERTILEAIDQAGPITAYEAGSIVYRLRGYRYILFVRRAWVTSTGARALEKLETAGILRRTQSHRWTRCSDLIGRSVGTVVISTLTTAKASKPFVGSSAQAAPVHAHDTPARCDFLGLPGPVTSSKLSSAASRGRSSYASGRTEPLQRLLAPGERVIGGQIFYSSAWLGDRTPRGVA